METGPPSSPEVRCRHRGPGCPRHSHADRYRPPFFGAFHALAIDDRGGGAGFPFLLLAAGDVERLMNAIQHTIALPPNEVVVDRAVGRKILRDIAPGGPASIRMAMTRARRSRARSATY